mmetsp:Transcript_12125/g.28246  ORF Transcript_12125/g.28246 Transcript_12125/m.28246 type:complete len:84 (+) Transcript_12125:175-426(+)
MGEQMESEGENTEGTTSSLATPLYRWRGLCVVDWVELRASPVRGGGVKAVILPWCHAGLIRTRSTGTIMTVRGGWSFVDAHVL